MLPVQTEKSVTCCSHFVTVPSLKSFRHSAAGNTFCVANCSLKSGKGTCGYCFCCNTSSASSVLAVRYSLPSAQALYETCQHFAILGVKVSRRGPARHDGGLGVVGKSVDQFRRTWHLVAYRNIERDPERHGRHGARAEGRDGIRHALVHQLDVARRQIVGFLCRIEEHVRCGASGCGDAFALEIRDRLDVIAHAELGRCEFDGISQEHLPCPRAGKFEITAPVESTSRLPPVMAWNSSRPVWNNLNSGSSPFLSKAPRWSASHIWTDDLVGGRGDLAVARHSP